MPTPPDIEGMWWSDVRRTLRGIARGFTIALVGGMMLQAAPLSQQPIMSSLMSFSTPDGGLIFADVYGIADHAVVLVAHGGYSSKASWAKPARVLADAGFRVLVFDTRAATALGAGQETACLSDPVCMAIDVRAAVAFLRQTRAKTVSVIGGSAGGGAVAQASVAAAPGEIDRLVLLAPMSIAAPEKMKRRKLFITSRGDRGSDDQLRLPGIRDQYERATDPKELVILEGSAHGQLMFGAPEGDRLMREVLRFLSAR